jgi:rRNA maturation protein Nop10
MTLSLEKVEKERLTFQRNVVAYPCRHSPEDRHLAQQLLSHHLTAVRQQLARGQLSLAEPVRELLPECGCEVVGPVPRVKEALPGGTALGPVVNPPLNLGALNLGA